MSFLSSVTKAIVKPIRWVASTVSGQKGRDLIDKNEELIRSLVAEYLETHTQAQSSLGGLLVVSDPHYTQFTKFVTDGGVPKGDSTAIAKEVAKRAIVGLRKSSGGLL